MCDEDTLVRLVKDVYGNKVLRKTLEIAKVHRVDLFGDLVEKLEPFLDRLRGRLGEIVLQLSSTKRSKRLKIGLFQRGMLN